MSSPTPEREHLEELIAGYVLGNLCSEEAEEFRKLLIQKPQLITEINQLQEVLGLLPYALPKVAPPPHLRSAIVEAVNIPFEANLARKQFMPAWTKIVGGVAAVFALTLGFDNYRLRQELSDNKDVIAAIQSPEAHLFSVKAESKGNVASASGTILMDFATDKALIALQNLPAPPPDKAYWLWAVVGNQTIRCGQFSIASSGVILDKISIPGDSYQDDAEISKLLVTLESSETPLSPSKPLVIASPS